MCQSVTSTSNPKNANCTIDQFKNNNGSLRYNLTLNFASRLSDAVMILKYSIPKHRDGRNYENLVYQATIMQTFWR